MGFLINVQAQLAQFMGCKAGSFPFLYLGLPLSQKKIPKKAYYPIIDKIKRRLAGWKTNKPIIHCGLYCSHKLCTHGHAHLLYVGLSVKKIEKIRRNSLWQGSSTSHKIPLASWAIVCQPKENGGLGIFDLKAMNLALLARWYWKWYKADSTLWNQFNIYNHGRFSICFATNHTLEKLITYTTVFCALLHIVGTGERTLFWHQGGDLVFFSNINSQIFTHLPYKEDATVREVITTTGQTC